jgi:hypothetical protein
MTLLGGRLPASPRKSARRQDHVNGPSFIEALPNPTLGDTQLARPICDTLGLPLMGDPAIPRHMARLLRLGVPRDIPRRIWAITMQAIQGKTFSWSRPKIHDESRKAPPPGINGDSSSAVEIPILAIRVRTSLPHGFPDAVLIRVFKPPCRSIPAKPITASACTASTGTERLSSDRFCFPTRTLTEPYRLSALRIAAHMV